MHKPRRKGVFINHVTLPDGISEVQYRHGVEYCARCDAMYEGPFAAMNLMQVEELGEDDDGHPLAVCRNRLACDGNLVQNAADDIDMVRDAVVNGKPIDRHYYEYLTAAFEALAQVYPGLTVEKPRCGECFGPLPEGADHESICRFCREKEDEQQEAEE